RLVDSGCHIRQKLLFQGFEFGHLFLPHRASVLSIIHENMHRIAGRHDEASQITTHVHAANQPGTPQKARDVERGASQSRAVPLDRIAPNAKNPRKPGQRGFKIIEAKVRIAPA
ncbi:hypothetical protein, partial [Rhizobium sp. CF122]|uniref:hypothetical protein n=1 Tax=Rhizobium sp. CF122 TaxID=1144312 RepID=UPI00056B91A7